MAPRAALWRPVIADLPTAMGCSRRCVFVMGASICGTITGADSVAAWMRWASSVPGIVSKGKRFLETHGIADAAGRLAVSRGPGERGYGGRVGEPTLLFSLHELSPWRRAMTPIEVTICTTRLAEQIRLAGIKHSNRLEQVLAARELIESSAEEGLQMNSRDELVCAISANLFLARDGELLTPPVESCGVAGTVRQLIIEELAPAAGVPVRIAPVKREHLPGFDELFLTNALHGIRSVWRCGESRFTSTHCGDTLLTSFHAWSESTGW